MPEVNCRNRTKTENRPLSLNRPLSFGMILCHTINRFNPLHNQIRGVSPRNDARGLYLEALRAMWDTNLSSKLNIPIDYISNLTENEFLNGFR